MTSAFLAYQHSLMGKMIAHECLYMTFPTLLNAYTSYESFKIKYKFHLQQTFNELVYKIGGHSSFHT